MPANVTPEYEKAERRHRQATSDEERLAALQDMLATIPKHKGTEKMQADIKHRLSQLRKEQQKPGHSKGPDPFHIPRSGAGQAVLVGPPNTGKSSLLAATTNAEVKVADYPYTTSVPQPGMWSRDHVQIELVDTPPLAPEHVPAGLMGTIRNADIVCVVIEPGATAPDQAETTLAVLSERGLTLQTAPRNQMNPNDPRRRCGLIVINKADDRESDAAGALQELYAGRLEVLTVSAHTKRGLDTWFQRLWELLAMVRVYAKEPGKPPDLTKPFALPAGSTVVDLAALIHRDLPEMMKFARLWGHGRFDGQPVHKTEPLQDRDVVEIHE
jgi:ribosome-interacting GTPase 1